MEKRALLKFVLAVLLFGSGGIVADHINMSASDIILYRSTIGAIVILIAFCIMRARDDHDADIVHRYTKTSIVLVIASGFCMGTGWIFLFMAYRTIGVGLSTVLYYTAPIIVMALAPWIFKEHLTIKKIMCFIVVVLGVAAINFSNVEGANSKIGFVCGILSAILLAALNIFNKKSGINGMDNAVIQLISCAVSMIIIVPILQGGIDLPSSTAEWGWVFILGAINTGIGCYLYFSSIGYLKVQTFSTLGYLEPMSAVCLAAIILGEHMNTLQIVGVVMIIGGAFVTEVSLPPARPKAK